MVPGDTIPADDEGAEKYKSAVCVITDRATGKGDARILRVVSTTTGHKLLQIVGCAFNYLPDDLVLSLLKDSRNILINEHSSSTVEKIGLICDGMSDNFLDVWTKGSVDKKIGRSRTTCTTVEIQKTSRGSRIVEKTCTTSIVKTSTSCGETISDTSVQHYVENESSDVKRKPRPKTSFRKNKTDVDRYERCERLMALCDEEPLQMMENLMLHGRNSERDELPCPNDFPIRDTEREDLEVADNCSVNPDVSTVERLSESMKDSETEQEMPRLLPIAYEGQEVEPVLQMPVLFPVPASSELESSECSAENSVPELGEQHERGSHVGLVNQAMTCYLNSLLQSLYMTPEFRNALYRWEFDNKKEDGVKSIPFQLQKLFLQLQISKKSAVGTTELTRSFGWDSSEAWQQHDVQELCRVMFEALEQRFAETNQSDLISRFYEGKMKDYVKCLECGYESAREDTFLDIPLVVRPFGSSQAYGSVEEALRAFVAPETLVESNQYFCEKCDKKCDAHKGLKFTKFPYLLTLHLKRFDFDPFTMHRIKLNDKVTFPQVLNLNEFVRSESEILEMGKSDIMMDSGSGFDEDASYKGSSTPSRDDEGEMLDVDEGIDVGSNGNHDFSADEKNLNVSTEKLPGPFVYELFSIMVHSGSANGGHYYAHIKSFIEGNWFCFNDVQVTKITYDDIRRTYGGGNNRGCYSSAYSSSANAYMLMYRQLDKEKNASFIRPHEFPPHIRRLLVEVEAMEKKEQEQLELEKAMCKIKLFASHPEDKMTLERRLVIHKDATLEEATGTAYELLGLNGVAPLECCRLVIYDEYHDSVVRSLEDCATQSIGEILGGVATNYKFDLFLDIRKPHEEFVSYQLGGITVTLHLVDLAKEEILNTLTFRSSLMQTVGELKQQIVKILDLQSSEMRLVLLEGRNVSPLMTPANTLTMEDFGKKSKVFVEYQDVEDAKLPFLDSKFCQLLNVYAHTISILVSLPKVDKDVLTSLGIPTNSDQTEKCVVELENEDEPRDSIEKQAKSENWRNGADQDCEDILSSGCQQSSGKAVNSDHSENSSLSSLTDSERTLVGDEMSPRNNSPVQGEEELWDNEEGSWYNHRFNGVGAFSDSRKDNIKVYFKAVPLEGNKSTLHVFIDSRLTLGHLKKQLEPFVGVGIEYFKLYRVYSGNQEIECTRLTDDMMSYSDNSMLAVKLGKALQKGEYKVKVCQLLVTDVESCRHLVDWVFAKGMTVLAAKKELLPEVISKTGQDVPLERCRLRKKSWKNPGTIFLDNQKFEDDIPIYPNWEVFLEVLSEPERCTSNSQLAVFLRPWHPSTFHLLPPMEIILNEATYEELTMRSSEASGIAVENLEFTKGVATFPCEMSPYNLQNSTWSSNFSCLSSITEDGCVLFCRDKMEVAKELSERKRTKDNLQQHCSNEDFSFPKTTRKRYFSPHKEKALKIYTDSSPSNMLDSTEGRPTT